MRRSSRAGGRGVRPQKAAPLCTAPRLIVAALLVIVAGAPFSARADEADGTFSVATVQFQVSPELYASPASFLHAVEPLVEEAVSHDADLVVFPEYINVFLITARYPEVVEHADSVSEALAGLARRAGVTDLPTLFKANASWLSRQVRRIWGNLADEHDVTIVAGTTFTPDSFDADSHSEGELELYNSALVFDEDGELVHRHDKAYLTPEEERELGLADARPEDATLFEVDGVEVGITICRDSYFGSWHRPLAGLDLWIDLRANGEPYSQEVRERFLGTLPERVRESSAVAGVNASLTGSFWEMVWEGPSYVVDADGRRVAASPAVRGSRVLLVELTPSGVTGEWRLGEPARRPQKR